jgi:hypothetical protein
LLLTPQELKVQFPDQVRAILDVRPNSLPPDAPFYIVSEGALRELNLVVNNGYFLDRPKDRQLLHFRGGAEADTTIKSGADNFQSKEVFGGIPLVRVRTL